MAQIQAAVERRINPPSLYAAFGSKDELFREAVKRHAGVIDEDTEGFDFCSSDEIRAAM